MPPCTWPSTIIGLMTLPQSSIARVALDRDLAGLGVDLDLGDVRAEREREVRRVVVRRRLEVRLDARRAASRRPRPRRELLDRLGALGRALDLPARRRPTRGRRPSTRAGAPRPGAPCRAPSRRSGGARCRRPPASASRTCRGRRATGRCRRGRPRPGRTGCRARSRRSATSEVSWPWPCAEEPVTTVADPVGCRRTIDDSQPPAPTPIAFVTADGARPQIST